MLKLAGALILMAGASSIGFGAAAQLRARVTSLRALIGGLELMERELSFRLTPMPDLLAVVAKRAQAPACYFFAWTMSPTCCSRERKLWSWRGWGRCWAVMTEMDRGRRWSLP